LTNAGEFELTFKTGLMDVTETLLARLVEMVALFADWGTNFFSCELIFVSSVLIRLLGGYILSFVFGGLISDSFVFMRLFAKAGLDCGFCELISKFFIFFCNWSII
jgi:hypothetical protein